ncbi:MAG: isoprenylcysteine carboxylmethyltransferase family protein, partial [Planctomycetota bacterium]|nr:isoprenylcysteine carboxylmethyltransferase family protein [Planctomycetota bacterium]
FQFFHWIFHHQGRNVTPTSKPRDDATLVTSGPYRFIRHPMYSFGLILFLSISLLSSSWFLALSGFVGFTLLALRTRVEERRLVEKFGEDYRHYQRTTGQFLPRLFSSASPRNARAS